MTAWLLATRLVHEGELVSLVKRAGGTPALRNGTRAVVISLGLLVCGAEIGVGKNEKARREAAEGPREELVVTCGVWAARAGLRPAPTAVIVEFGKGKARRRESRRAFDLKLDANLKLNA